MRAAGLRARSDGVLIVPQAASRSEGGFIMKPRFRIDKLEDRIAPTVCLADPLFCGSLRGGASAVTVDADAFVGDGTTSICSGDTGGNNPTYELTTAGGNTVQLNSQATLGICAGVAGSLSPEPVPCS